MAVHDHIPKRRRRAGRRVPTALAVCVVALAGVIPVAWMEGPEAAPAPSLDRQLRDIALVAHSDIALARTVDDTIDRVIAAPCDATGCLAEGLPDAILDYAEAMTRDQLLDARRDQVRQLRDRMHDLAGARRGSGAARSARQEVIVSARLVHLYSQALRTGH